jgi:probable addiction module antidote protein
MPKRTSEYQSWLHETLTDPLVAANYLRAAMSDSEVMFLIALRNVAEAHRVSSVARGAKLSRESLYRMLSPKGNPTYTSLRSVLRTVGLRLSVEPVSSAVRVPPAMQGGDNKVAQDVQGTGIANPWGLDLGLLAAQHLWQDVRILQHKTYVLPMAPAQEPVGPVSSSLYYQKLNSWSIADGQAEKLQASSPS